MQSIHAVAPARIGEPSADGRHSTPANLSAPDLANVVERFCWSCARTLTQNRPVASIFGQDDPASAYAEIVEATGAV